MAPEIHSPVEKHHDQIILLEFHISVEHTSMDLTLKVNLFDIWVSAGCDVNGRLISVFNRLANRLYEFDQIQVILRKFTPPIHYFSITMLRGSNRKFIVNLACDYYISYS